MDKVSLELKKYFESNTIFKLLLSFDNIIVYGAVGVKVLGEIISLGGLINALAYYMFFVGILLAFANSKNLVLIIGLGGQAVFEAIKLISSLIRFKSLSYYSLIGLLVYGGLTYLLYKKSFLKS